MVKVTQRCKIRGKWYEVDQNVTAKKVSELLIGNGFAVEQKAKKGAK